MKKLFLITSFILALGATLLAQDCATGYCPSTITVHHKAGDVSPITANITYGVTKVLSTSPSTYKCWITRNLGATTAPTSFTDNTFTANGWYWEFNRKQGFYFGSTSTYTMTPSFSSWISSISESADWQANNDPCSLLLGSAWRIPTYAELYTNMCAGLWGSSLYSAYALHSGGNGNTAGSGWGNTPGNGSAYLWTATGAGTNAGLTVLLGTSANSSGPSLSKIVPCPLRCLRTF